MSNFNIIAQPMSQGVYPGGSVPLSVLVGGGSGSYTYQWLYDGSNIPSASSSSYSVATYNPATNTGKLPGQYAVSTSDGTTTILSNTVFVGTLTNVQGTPTDMVTVNNVPYKSSFVWELNPVTSLPVKVKVVNSF